MTWEEGTVSLVRNYLPSSLEEVRNITKEPANVPSGLTSVQSACLQNTSFGVLPHAQPSGAAMPRSLIDVY